MEKGLKLLNEEEDVKDGIDERLADNDEMESSFASLVPKYQMMSILNYDASLCELHLAYYDFEHDATALNGIIDSCPLETIHLVSCKLSKTTLTAIGTNKTLRRINLECNNIGPDGAIALTEGFNTTTSTNSSCLVQVHLGMNHIGRVGAAALSSKMLLACPSIKVFDLRYNKIGNSGVACVAKALERTLLLKELFLDGNGISNMGALALARAVKVQEGLQRLSLDENVIGDVGVAALRDAIRFSVSLRSIGLYHNACSVSLVQEMEGLFCKEM